MARNGFVVLLYISINYEWLQKNYGQRFIYNVNVLWIHDESAF